MSAENALDRVIWLHKRIRGESYPNAMRLAERFGISHRQAQRDVDYLKNALGAPVEFSPARRGYYYTADFDLPDSIREEDPEDYADMLAHAEREAADDGATQMSIPYTAVLQIRDKLAVVGLGRFASGRAPGAAMYRCEFHNVGFFLGALLATDSDIRIVEPDWLRERMLNSLKKLMESNSK